MPNRLIATVFELGAFVLPAWTQGTVQLYPIIEDRKLGFIDSSGHQTIKPQFDTRASCWYGEWSRWPRFSEGLAPASTGRNVGYIDPTGEFVIPPQFSSAGPFHDGIAVVRIWVDPANLIESGPIWINAAGKRLFTGTIKQWGANFHDGLLPLASFKNGDCCPVWGYVDTSFQWVIPPHFHNADEFGEGLALVQFEDSKKRAFVDQRGRLAIDLSRYGLDARFAKFSDGLASVYTPEPRGPGHIGFIDRSGREIIPPVFVRATSFVLGYAWAARCCEKLSVIDKTGNAVAAEELRDHSDFDEGLAAAVNWKTKSQGFGLIGFIDPTGSWIIAPQFSEALGFTDGLARVSWGGVRGEYGYIDKLGRVVWKGECKEGPPL